MSEIAIHERTQQYTPFDIQRRHDRERLERRALVVGHEEQARGVGALDGRAVCEFYGEEPEDGLEEGSED
jgi:hypothetical protein